MYQEHIKKILFSRINYELLRKALGSEQIPESAVYVNRLLVAITETTPNLLIEFPWQLSGFGSGFKNYSASIEWDARDNWGSSPLHYVAWSGKLPAFKEALKKILEQQKALGASEQEQQDVLIRHLATVNTSGMGLIHFAAWSGDSELLEFVLLALNENTTIALHENEIELYFDDDISPSEIIKMNLKQEDYRGISPLHYAAWSGEINQLKWVLDREYNVLSLSKEDDQGLTPIHYALWSGELNLVQWMMQAIVKGDMGFDFYFDSSNKEKVIPSLCSQGKIAFLTAQDKQGLSSVYYAVKSRNSVLLQWIGSGDSRILARKDNQGRSAVHYVLESEDLDLLIDIYANDRKALGYRDNGGRSAIHYAAKTGNIPLLQWIYERDGKSLNYQDNEGMWAVHHAVISDRIELLQWMFARDRLTLTKKDGLGWIALDCAALSSKKTCFDWILEHDTKVLTLRDPGAQDFAHFAVKFGDSDLVQKVFDRNPASFTSEDSCDYTPVHSAALRKDNSDILALLFDLTQLKKFTVEPLEGYPPEEVKVVYDNLLKVLETNMLLKEVEYPCEVPINPKTRQGIDTRLARNREFVEQFDRSVKPRLMSYFFSSGAKKEYQKECKKKLTARRSEDIGFHFEEVEAPSEEQVWAQEL